MKKMNKLLALVLAMVMVLGLATVASAATVNVPETGILAGHSFTAYQIFSGREENGVLSDVEWGEGINSTAFLTALQGDTTYGNLFTNCSEAAEVAKVLSDNNSVALGNAVAKLAYANKIGNGTALTSGENTLADGYYLVVDTTENVAAGSAYNASLLQVVGNIDIAVKTDAPTVEKKVKENVKPIAASDYADRYNDVADYNIGDAVPFQLIGTVPDMSRYDTYKYIFHDTLSDGLSLKADSIKVYVASDKKGSDKLEITEGWTKAVDGQSFTVSFNNLKTVTNVAENKFIIVEYTATLNTSAVVGLPGNPNGVYLEYSNKPDQSGSGDKDNTGKTPWDYVIVFTYELDTTKVDGQKSDTKLKDAKFVLLNSDKSQVATVDASGKFAGWVTVPPAGENNVITWPTNSVLTSNENGLFSVVGLDDGTYNLREIVAPAGYNLLAADIEVVISATTVNGQNWSGSAAGDTDGTVLTNLAVTADGEDGIGDKDTGKASITVANNKGSTLPETGGIGTTIFYVLGGMLVVCAVVLMVSKKRMSAEG